MKKKNKKKHWLAPTVFKSLTSNSISLCPRPSVYPSLERSCQYRQWWRFRKLLAHHCLGRITRHILQYLTNFKDNLKDNRFNDYIKWVQVPKFDSVRTCSGSVWFTEKKWFLNFVSLFSTFQKSIIVSLITAKCCTIHIAHCILASYVRPCLQNRFAPHLVRWKRCLKMK